MSIENIAWHPRISYMHREYGFLHRNYTCILSCWVWYPWTTGCSGLFSTDYKYAFYIDVFLVGPLIVSQSLSSSGFQSLTTHEPQSWTPIVFRPIDEDSYDIDLTNTCIMIIYRVRDGPSCIIELDHAYAHVHMGFYIMYWIYIA